MTKLTKSQTIQSDIYALLRARTPLIWVVSPEEARTERALFAAVAEANYFPYTWDCGQGVANIGGKVQNGEDGTEKIGSNDCGETLAAIAERATAPAIGTEVSKRAVWIFRDFHKWLNDPVTQRQLKNLVRKIPTVPRANAQSIIVISSSADIPKELEGEARVVKWSLPDRTEIAEIVDRIIEQYKNNDKITVPTNGARDAVIDAAVGLSEAETMACITKSLVQRQSFDPILIANDKKSVIAKSGVLEWFDPLEGGLQSVGGLNNLKAWLLSRAKAFSKKAREYFKCDDASPKGVLLVGIPGCGKSLIAKAIATAWSVPLIRVDLGSLKSKFVGDSEAKIRSAFDTIDAIGRCVVWLDEIEKALAGATEGAADGGVSKDALGFLLTWLQEKKSESFIVATSNDISALPPELIRRFDETFYVDFPSPEERIEIIKVTLRKYGRAEELATAAVVGACESFTGSEVAEVVKGALYLSFADDERELTAADMIAAAKEVYPLYKTSPEKIEKLKKFAKEGRAKPATATKAVVSKTEDAGLILLD